eukprot:11408-Heterococcus_DN1.PRE.5
MSCEHVRVSLLQVYAAQQCERPLKACRVLQHLSLFGSLTLSFLCWLIGLQLATCFTRASLHVAASTGLCLSCAGTAWEMTQYMSRSITADYGQRYGHQTLLSG